MAKVAIEIQDQPAGELHVLVAVDGLRTAATKDSNTAAQDVAVYLAQEMRAVGIGAPYLGAQ